MYGALSVWDGSVLWTRGERTPEFPRQHSECVSKCGEKLKPPRLTSDEGMVQDVVAASLTQMSRT